MVCKHVLLVYMYRECIHVCKHFSLVYMYGCYNNHVCLHTSCSYKNIRECLQRSWSACTCAHTSFIYTHACIQSRSYTHKYTRAYCLQHEDGLHEHIQILCTLMFLVYACTSVSILMRSHIKMHIYIHLNLHIYVCILCT